MAEPASTVEFWRYQDGSFEPDQTHNVFHWLCGRLEYNEELDKRFQEYAKTHPDEYPMVLMEEFAQFHGNSIIDSCSKPSVINTYNYDQMVSQILQFICWEDSDGQHVLLQIHGGADVREGILSQRHLTYLNMMNWRCLITQEGVFIALHVVNIGIQMIPATIIMMGVVVEIALTWRKCQVKMVRKGKVGVVVVTKDHEAFCPMCGKAKLEAHI